MTSARMTSTRVISAGMSCRRPFRRRNGQSARLQEASPARAGPSASRRHGTWWATGAAAGDATTPTRGRSRPVSSPPRRPKPPRGRPRRGGPGRSRCRQGPARRGRPAGRRVRRRRRRERAPGPRSHRRTRASWPVRQRAGIATPASGSGRPGRSGPVASASPATQLTTTIPPGPRTSQGRGRRPPPCLARPARALRPARAQPGKPERHSHRASKHGRPSRWRGSADRPGRDGES